MVTVEALVNSRAQTVLDGIRPRLQNRSVSSVRAAISFLMESGAREIDRDVRRLIRAGLPVTIVFGDDFHLTQSAALARLMSAGCDLRLFTGESNDGFHPKVWLLDYVDGTRTAIVGSSNLSRGGLVTNVEASALIEGVASETQSFEELWDEILAQSHDFTAQDLKAYKDSEKAAAVPPPRRRRRAPTPNAPNVRQHVERWQAYIARPHRLGSSEQWRGWYLVPEQGQLNEAKFVELGRILAALRAQPQYVRDGSLSLGTGAQGVRNAVQALAAGGVTTHHPYTDRQRRDLFVRQQRLYLQTFGWLEQLDQHTFRVTPAGVRFEQAKSARQRSRLFTDAISLKKWPFGPIAFYPFLLDLLRLVPDQRLYYDELNLIVIHTYHRSELFGIANLVAEYRALSDTGRAHLHGWADQRLRRLLSAHAGHTAYGRYRRKVADLMVAFGSTTQVVFHPDADEDRSYVRLK